MSLYILDTDILSLLQDRHPQVVTRVTQCPISDLAISVISVEEQLSGWYSRLRQAKKPDQLANIYRRLTNDVTALARLKILTFSEPAIHVYKQLHKQIPNVRKNDLRIAAIVLDNNAIVVTRNRVDFQRVPGIVIENWSQ